MAPPRQDLAGQASLNDWYGQINNLLTIVDILDVLLPVQDMLPFQRRIRDFEFPLQLSVGEKGLVQGIVPNGETWRILWAGLASGDSAVKITVLDISPRDLTKAAVIVSRINVAAGANATLYPSSPLADGDEIGPRTGPPYDAFPGDRVRINDLSPTAAVGPVTWTAFLRYEVLPPPIRAERDERFVGIVIP